MSRLPAILETIKFRWNSVFTRRWNGTSWIFNPPPTKRGHLTKIA